MPAMDKGRQIFKTERKLTPQNKPFAELDNRDILLELLTWEHVAPNPTEQDDAATETV